MPHAQVCLRPLVCPNAQSPEYLIIACHLPVTCRAVANVTFRTHLLVLGRLWADCSEIWDCLDAHDALSAMRMRSCGCAECVVNAFDAWPCFSRLPAVISPSRCMFQYTCVVSSGPEASMQSLKLT